MGFHFRFSALLKQRRYELKQAQLELARARQSHDQALSAQKELGKKIILWQETWRRDQSKGITVNQHLLSRDYLLSLERELDRADLRVAQKAKELDERIVHLLECEKKVKMLEILQEKDLNAFKSGCAQRDQKILDEMATLRREIR